MTKKKIIDSLNIIAKEYPELAEECSRQMPYKTGKKFKYKIGQKITNEQIGKIIIYNRWHGKDINFYDVLIIKSRHTCTFDETEVVQGYRNSNKQ